MAQKIQTTTRSYRDLDLNFIPNPVTGDVAIRTGDNAVINSVKNLIFTNFYERPFHPEIGSGVRRLLFDNADVLTAENLKKAISTVLDNFEPRVSIKNLIVKLSDDLNKFQVILEFFILNNTKPTNISFFLERVR
jgi:phage baseplate assembly protein W